MSIKDKSARNVVHYIVDHGGTLTNVLHTICAQAIGRQMLNDKDGVSGSTPLHCASKSGHLHVLESLLQLGATANSKNNHAQSPLHFAARYGRIETVRRLLRSNASVINECDDDGMTALHTASMNGHDKVVQLLLQNGALLHKFVNRKWQH